MSAPESNASLLALLHYHASGIRNGSGTDAGLTLTPKACANVAGQLDSIAVAFAALLAEGDAKPASVPDARPLDDWHEDLGDCVWWAWHKGEWRGEPAHIGSPLDSDWPGYHTHWIPHPSFPSKPDAERDTVKGAAG